MKVEQVIEAFCDNRRGWTKMSRSLEGKRGYSDWTDGEHYQLWYNTIAVRDLPHETRKHAIRVSLAGWDTNLTRGRLNRISQQLGLDARITRERYKGRSETWLYLRSPEGRERGVRMEAYSWYALYPESDATIMER